MSLCEVCSLSKEYPKFSLRGISFSLEEGSITGFIGQNGAGKTTTLKAMLNFVHPSGGEVRFFGLPFVENEAKIKSQIGFSIGAVNYYPKKTLRELADVTKRFYPDWDESAYRKYLALFSLDDSKTPSELSEGMKVKANLLLALSHKAKLLILDEPTSGLDPFSRDELTDLFILLKKQGIAILFSTHIISDLEKCADRIVYIQKGRMIAFDTKEAFREKFGLSGETLEQTILRLEKEARS